MSSGYTIVFITWIDIEKHLHDVNKSLLTGSYFQLVDENILIKSPVWYVGIALQCCITRLS